MPYVIRLMTEADIPQVTDLEREVFPEFWPPTSFRSELRNNIAEYLVAQEETSHNPAHASVPEEARPRGFWQGVTHHIFSRPPSEPPGFLVGYAGLWFMAEESHLTAIGVRTRYRRRGMGELLLIASIEKAIARKASFMTLEVRVSNIAAQALYEKYDFNREGLRAHYYSDNGEDAVIMTTDPLTSASFQGRYQELKEVCLQHWNGQVRLL